jgi:diguanylate cyclase (GGDEF)-like protein/PAS domain S-box-containing protein
MILSNNFIGRSYKQLAKKRSIGSYWLVLCLLIVNLNSLAKAAQLKLEALTDTTVGLYSFASVTALDSININQIHQDSSGFIWLATEQGVFRYDGQNLDPIYPIPSKMNASTEEKIQSNNNTSAFTERHSIHSVSFDSDRTLWLSTHQGLIHWPMEQSSSFENAELLQFPALPSRAENANWLLGSQSKSATSRWVITNNGVYIYDQQGKDIQFAKDMAMFNNGPISLLSYYIDGSDLWLGSDKGLYRYDLTQQKLTKLQLTGVSSDLTISHIMMAKTGQLLFAGKEGLFIATVNGTKLSKVKQVETTTVTSLVVGTTKAYYSSNQSIQVFDLIKETQKPLIDLTQFNGSPANRAIEVSSLFLDEQSNLWIASVRNGTFLWDSKQETSKVIDIDIVNDSLAHSSIKINQLVQNGQKFWLATDIGLVLFEQSVFKLIVPSSTSPYISPGSSNQTFAVDGLINTDESLWLASHKGLLRYKIGSKTIQRFVPSHLELNSPFIVHDFVLSDARTIWLATNIGLLTFDIELSSFSYDKNLMSQISSKPVEFLSLTQNHLIVEFDNQLISYNLESKRKKVIQKSQTLIDGSQLKLSVVLQVEDYLWVGYENNGLYLLKNNENSFDLIKHFHTSNGFPTNQIFAMEHKDQEIWAGTANGLILINTVDQSYVQIKQPKRLSHFKFSAGSSIKTTDNELLFAGYSEILHVTPEALKQRIGRPLSTISKVTLSSRKQSDELERDDIFWPLTRTIQLKQPTDFVTVYLTSLNYSLKNPVLVEYWTNHKPEKIESESEHFTLNDFNQDTTIYVRSKESHQTDFSAIQNIKVVVPESDYQLFSPSNIPYLIIIVGLVVIWLKKSPNHKKSNAHSNYDHEKLIRLELALLSGSSGTWDCSITPENLMESSLLFYSKDQPVKKMTITKYLSNIHPDDVVEIEKNWRDLLTGEVSHLDSSYRVVEASEWKWNEIHGQTNTFNDSKQPIRASGVWSLSNQERHLEQQLNVFASALQSTQDIVIFLNKDLNVIQVNNAYERLTGFTRETLIGKNMVDIAFSRFTEQETEKIHQIVVNEKQWQGESSVPRKNAASFPVDIRIDIITKEHREIGYVVVMSDISHLKSNQKPNVKTSFYDSITGLPNKTLGFDRLRILLKRAKQDLQPLSIIFLSIDQYAELAETLKKDSLSSLMNQLCMRLLPYVQQDDVLAKYEPDTFLLILKLTDGGKAVLPLVNQLLREVAKSTTVEDSKLNISACAGISSYPNDGENWSELVTKAETALIHSKKQGKNLFRYYDEVSNKKALERKKTENKLARALSEGELFLVFQPVISLSSSKTVELDINLRWKPQNERIIYPSQFLAIAEEIGRLKQICEWLIEQSFSTLNRWNQEGLAVSINLNIPVCYLQEDDAIPFIQSKMALYKINPKFLFIAITENDISEKTKQLKTVSERLYSLGIGLVLDDFGKDNASLGNLRELKLHSIKIDRALVRNIGRRPFTDQLLASFITMSNDLAIGTIAKGIETEQQLDFLTEKHCQYGQGFYISDPLNESQIRQLLLER